MKKNIIYLLFAALLLCSMLFTGCGTAATASKASDVSAASSVSASVAPSSSGSVSESAKSSEAASAKQYTIGLFVKDSTTPFWRYVVQGATKEAEKQGVKIVEYAPAKNTDTAQQIGQVEDAIQSGIDAICIVAIDAKAITSALQKAIDAKIPVITFNSKVALDGIKTFVGVDNYDGSYKMTEKMFADNHNQGNLVILESDPAAYVNKERVRAVTDLVAKNTNIKILTQQPAYARREQAMTVMENILQTYDKIDMVWSLNDATALGAVQAIDAAGRTGIKVSGFDGTPEGIKAVLDGKLAYTLDQSPYQQGAYSIRAAVDILNGKTVESVINTGGTIIDKTNGQAVLDEFYKDAK